MEFQKGASLLNGILLFGAIVLYVLAAVFDSLTTQDTL